MPSRRCTDAPSRTLRIQHQPEQTLSGAPVDRGHRIGDRSRPAVDRIFRAMFTTKSSGMGMGLSIRQSIVESHKGRIWAAPGDESGSVFHVELPTTVAEH